MQVTKVEHQQLDVSARRVARVYAESLMGAADKTGQFEGVLEELDSVVNDVLTDARMQTLLSMAALGRKAREEVIRKSFGPRASPLFLNFLLVLNVHDRLDLLRAILIEMQVLHDEKLGRTVVQVSSAVPLTEQQKGVLVEDLRRKFAVEPILKEKVDPSLLGGVRIRIGDWQYDATVRTRIDNLRQQILERSSHEIQSRRDRFSSAV